MFFWGFRLPRFDGVAVIAVRRLPHPLLLIAHTLQHSATLKCYFIYLICRGVFGLTYGMMMLCCGRAYAFITRFETAECMHDNMRSHRTANRNVEKSVFLRYASTFCLFISFFPFFFVSFGFVRPLDDSVVPNGKKFTTRTDRSAWVARMFHHHRQAFVNEKRRERWDIGRLQCTSSIQFIQKIQIERFCFATVSNHHDVVVVVKHKLSAHTQKEKKISLFIFAFISWFFSFRFHSLRDFYLGDCSSGLTECEFWCNENNLSQHFWIVHLIDY